MWETTEKAVRDAIEMLLPDGIVLIAVYPGHEEGNYDGQMLERMLSEYDRRRICVSCFRIVNSPTSPYFYIAEKK